jgi:hypothetical protein
VAIGGGGGRNIFYQNIKKIFRTYKKFSVIPKNFSDILKNFRTYQNLFTFCVILVNLAKFLLTVLLFHPNHSNIFAAYGNDLPIKPLFCRKDVFRGVSHPPHSPPIATALVISFICVYAYIYKELCWALFVIIRKRKSLDRCWVCLNGIFGNGGRCWKMLD